ncbi:hypothetical protein J6590_044723 [Homalodisca vitripennis]|nr:hypothetical protein J6590_044723 [Homalodisca vitripennis]
MGKTVGAGVRMCCCRTATVLQENRVTLEHLAMLGLITGLHARGQHRKSALSSLYSPPSTSNTQHSFLHQNTHACHTTYSACGCAAAGLLPYYRKTALPWNI